jgi:hypothetical protein
MAIDADLVCTDADLEGYTLGKQNLQNLLPEEWLKPDESEKTAKKARQQILNDVLKKLAEAGVTEGEITDPTTLRNVVAYGTLWLVFLNAPLVEGSPNFKRSAEFKKMYDTELASLIVIDEDGEAQNSPLQIEFERG